MTRAFPIALLSLAGVLASACSGEAASVAAAQTPEASRKALPRACAIVTAEEATIALGSEVALMADDPENCVWTAAGAGPGQLLMFMVQLAPAGSRDEAQMMFDAASNITGDLNALINSQVGERTKKSGASLEGLGDDAWQSGSNADLVGTQQLVVRKGNVVLSFNVTGMTKTGRLQGFEERMRTLARTAVGRI
ncbi:MAG: hypothetical protein ABW136_12185 [Steroidobacteraceae bacterium]